MVVQALDRSELLRSFVPRLEIQWLREFPGVRYLQVPGSLAFVDISGFTSLTERLAKKGKIGAEELNEVLDAVFGELLDIAYADGAGLIKWGGDAVLLLFHDEEHAARACHAAYGMRRAMRGVGQVRTSVGQVKLRMSVGIHSGTFDFFLVGEDHLELIITGPGGTECAAMEGIAEAGEIAISQATAALLPRSIVGQPKDRAILLAGEPKVAPRMPETEFVVGDLDLASCIPVAVRDHLLDTSREPEHRQLTVAFIEFSGVDRFIAANGPDVLADVLDELVRSVQRACRQHGVTFFGTDISKDGGKIIMMAGAPRSTGEDEERVLLAARRVVDEGCILPIRVGVNSGYVFTGDFGPPYRRTYDIKGDAVNLAARLMAKAEIRQIVATPRVLERSQTTFETTELEPFPVKGKKQPIEALVVGRIIGSRQDDARAEDLPLVGRDKELVLLSAGLDDARAGRGRVVEIVGPAGIGKTRLLGEVRAAATGFHVVAGACELYQASTPYHAVRSILRTILGIPQDATTGEAAQLLRRRVSEQAPTLLPWLPLLAIPFDVEVETTLEADAIDPQFRKQRVEDVVAELLSAAVVEPTLVAIEDVHWMDEVSRDLLLRLSRSVGEHPWMICVTRRDDETGFVAPEGPASISVRPKPLGELEAAELLAMATEGAPLRPDQVRSLAERAGGNPLFLRELVLAARRAGSVEDLPASVEALMTAQIDRLASSDRRLLRHAAVLGASFTDDLVETLYSGSGEERPDPAAWLRLGEFVMEEGPGLRRFRHALMRDAAYEGLTYRRRRELHGRVADALVRSAETGPEDLAELLSMHFHHAQRFGEAWGYSRIAGDRASGKYANTEAVTFYERAIEAGRRLGEVAPRELSSLHEALGDVRERLGDYPGALAAYGAARRYVGDEPVLVAQLFLKEAVVTSRAGGYRQSLRWTSRGRRLLQTLKHVEADRKRARLSAWYAHIRRRQGRRAEAIRWARLAIEEAKTSGEQEALASAYRTLDLTNVELGRYEDVTHYPLALAIYEQLGDLDQCATVNNDLGAFSYYQGRWDDALGFYGKARDQWQRAGDLPSVAIISANVAEILSDRGQLEEAERMGREALRIWQGVGLKSAIAYGLNIVGRVACRSGRYAEAVELLERARALNHEIGDQPEELESDVRIAECLAMQGRAAEALDLATEALARSEALGGPATPQLQRVRGYALAQLGRFSEARRALEESAAGARDREAEYEEALALQGLTQIATIEGSPEAPELEARYRAIFDHLGVVAASVLPIGGEAPQALSPS